MRKVRLAGTDLESSCIGFGCASLGSRVAPAKGLRALAEAHEAGVTWFDVAPPYGAGEAQAILGRFLSGKREGVVLVSKVGLTPPKNNAVMKAIYATARPFVGMAKSLRGQFRKIPATRNAYAPLTPGLIRSTIEDNLATLGTDRLDVFALHDPSPDDVTRDDILRSLEDVVTSGKARYLSVAGKSEAAQAALTAHLPYSFIQLADDPVHSPLARLRDTAERPFAAITHSVMGVGGALDMLVSALKARPDLEGDLRAAGYDGPVDKIAADLLLDRALASNADGVVLLSMFSDRHRADNLARAAAPVREDAPALLETVLEAVRPGTAA